jgi:hypothetical protein
MSQIYRIEVAVREKAVASNGLPRFVVVVELSDQVISALGNPGLPELHLKALGIAMHATWCERVKYRTSRLGSYSSSVVLDANLADFGVANFKAGDGCRAWILESPCANPLFRLVPGHA